VQANNEEVVLITPDADDRLTIGSTWTFATNTTFVIGMRSAANYGVTHIRGNLQFDAGAAVEVALLDGFNGMGTFYVAYADDITGTLPPAPAGYNMAVEAAGARKRLKLWATLSFPPQIVNNAVSSLTLTSADLIGTLNSAGTDPTVLVQVFWGPVDGGTNKAQWASNTVWDIPSPPDFTPFTNSATLSSNTIYYYTYYASNSVGECWPTPSAKFMTGPVTIEGTDTGAAESPVDSGVLTVRRPDAATNGALTVSIAASGTALTNDYTSSVGMPITNAVFAEGQATVPITLTPVYDTRYEPNETVTLTVSPGSYLVGSPGSATVTITNYDSGETGSRWTGTNNAKWSVSGNWLNGVVPNAVDAIALMKYFITNALTVDLDIDATVGQVVFEDTDGDVSNWTIGGSKTLTFDTSSGNGLVRSVNGANTIQRPVVLNDSVTVDVAGPTQYLAGAVTGGGGVTKVGAGAAQFSSAANDWRGPTVVSNGLLQFSTAYGAPERSDFTIAADGTFNFNAHDVIGSLAGTGNVIGASMTGNNNDQLTFGITEKPTTFNGTVNGMTGGFGFMRKTGTNTFRIVNAPFGGVFSVALTVADGRVLVRDGGNVNATCVVLSGGILEFDDTGIQLQDRFGGPYGNSLSVGGELIARGNTNANTKLGKESNQQLNMNQPGNPTMTLIPGGSGRETQVIQYNGVNNDYFVIGGALAALVRGDGLGQTSGTRSRLTIRSNNFHTEYLVGAGVSGGGVWADTLGSGGTPKVNVVLRMYGDTNSTGNGIGFVTYDQGADHVQDVTDVGVRALTAAEYSNTVASGEGAAITDIQNKRLGTAISGIDAATRINSLVLESGGSLAGAGTLTVHSGMFMSTGTNGSLSVANVQVAGRQITLITPDADDLMTISSALTTTQSQALVKAGYGTAVLTGNNAYTGVTTISRGVLRATDNVGLPTNSNLRFTGGVLESSGTFSRNLGTGGNGVQWFNSLGVSFDMGGFADGGFAANGGSLAIRLNGNTNRVTWDAANFVPGNRALVLGSLTADNVVDFQNALDLGPWSGVTGGRRTIRVVDNPNSAADSAKISGPISGTNADVMLIKDGSGALLLAATNTYAGPTLVAAGTLEFMGTLTGGVTVATGGGISPTTPAGGAATGTVFNGMTFASNATMLVHWYGPDNYDVLDVKGTLTFAAGSRLQIVVVSGQIQGREIYLAFADSIVGLPEVLGPGRYIVTVDDVGGRKALHLRPPPAGAVFILR
jgi:autotransporter-associated beta strand protein